MICVTSVSATSERLDLLNPTFRKRTQKMGHPVLSRCKKNKVKGGGHKCPPHMKLAALRLARLGFFEFGAEGCIGFR